MRRPRLYLYLFIFGCLAVVMSLSLATPQSPAAADSPPSANCVIHPYGMISQSMAEGFNRYWPLYLEIANQTGVDPILIAPLHYREHFGLDNPANSQGIFQQYSLVRSGQDIFPSTHKQPVSIDEFVRQGVLAIKHLKSKVKTNIDTSPSDKAVQSAYWGYNGRTWRYDFQVRPGQPRFDGSPYVMNEPGIRNLKMVTHDGGKGKLRTDPRPGAWPIYRDLRAVCLAPAPAAPEVTTSTLAAAVVTTPETTAPAPPVETQSVDFVLLPSISPKEAEMKEPFGKADWSPNLIEVSFSQSKLWLAIASLSLLMAMIMMIIHRRAQKSEAKNDTSGLTEPSTRKDFGWKGISLAIVFSAGMALVGDYLDDGWNSGQILRNFGLIAAESLKWFFYGPRLTILLCIMFGMFLGLSFALYVEAMKAGKPGVKDTVKGWISTVLEGIKLILSMIKASQVGFIPFAICFGLVLIGQHQAKMFSAIYITLVMATLAMTYYVSHQTAGSEIKKDLVAESSSDSKSEPKTDSKSRKSASS